MPLHRRLPKRGFTNIFRKEFQIVNIADFERCEVAEITGEVLRDAGLIKKLDAPVKILGNGNVEKAFTVKANAFTKAAVEKIEAAGGTVTTVTA